MVMTSYHNFDKKTSYSLDTIPHTTPIRYFCKNH